MSLWRQTFGCSTWSSGPSHWELVNIKATPRRRLLPQLLLNVRTSKFSELTASLRPSSPADFNPNHSSRFPWLQPSENLNPRIAHPLVSGGKPRGRQLGSNAVNENTSDADVARLPIAFANSKDMGSSETAQPIT